MAKTTQNDKTKICWTMVIKSLKQQIILLLSMETDQKKL